MKFSQLRNLIAVAEMGSVRQAAIKLNLSQPAVTKSIKQLEETVGALLLERGTHGVTTTASGRALVERARIIDSEIKRAQREVEFLEGARAGEISIAVTPTVSTNFLPQAVTSFSANRPRVRIYVEEGIVSEILTSVRRGEFDFAVCFLPGPLAQAEEGLKIETLIAESFVPAVRNSHPLAGKKNLTLKDLLDENWIIFGRGEGRRFVYDQTFTLNDLDPPSSSLESNSIPFTITLLENSDNIALLPSQIFTTKRIGQSITPLNIATNMPGWTISIVIRTDTTLSPVCRELISEIRGLVK